MSSDVRRVHALPEIVKQRLTICDKSTGYKMANTLAGSFLCIKERWISIQIHENLKICM